MAGAGAWARAGVLSPLWGDWRGGGGLCFPTGSASLCPPAQLTLLRPSSEHGNEVLSSYFIEVALCPDCHIHNYSVRVWRERERGVDAG